MIGASDYCWPHEEHGPGAAYVVLGGALGPEPAPELTQVAAVTLTDGEQGTVCNGLAVESAGDLDGDGSGDLLVASSTAVWLVPASLLDTTDVELSRGIRIDGRGYSSGGYYADTARSAGDVDGDGLADTIAACQVCGGTDDLWYGEAYLFLGATLPAAGGSLAATDADLTVRGPDQVRFGQNTGAGGDLDGDGRDDWGVSSWEGGIYLYYRSAGLVGTDARAADADLHITPEDEGGAYGEIFGDGMSFGDIDGDGALDLAALDREPDVNYLVFLNSQLVIGTLPAEAAARSYTGLVGPEMLLYGPLRMDGDIDGDGSSELVMGLPWASDWLDDGHQYRDGAVVIIAGD